MHLSGKVALVTGASRGIGRSIAIALARQGCRLALVARSEDGLKHTAGECAALGASAEIFPFDLTHTQRLPQLIRAIREKMGTVHILVNDAGRYETGDPLTSDLAAWDQTLDLNFRSVYHLTNQLLEEMLKHEESAVVNICSIASLMTSAGGEIYSASKHALKGYGGSLFESIREKGAKVVNIYPGFVNTDLVDQQRLIAEKMIQPDDIASSVIWALAMPGNACATDITIRPQRSPYRK
jgi:3-oxoacyl-[acyl-carrier protein] reductase